MELNKQQIVKPTRLKSFALSSTVLVLMLLLANSQLGQGIRYHMETITSFSLRYYLNLEPKLSDKIKIFIYDDPTVATLKKYDFTLSEWADLLRALALRNPQAIIVDKIFDDPVGLEEKDKLIAVTQDFPGKIHIANFSTPDKITGREEIDIRSEWQHTSLPDAVKRERRHYLYGAHEAIESSLSSGHIRYEDRGLVRPYSHIIDNTAVPHISFKMFPSDSVNISASGISIDTHSVPIKEDGTARVNQIHGQTLIGKTYNMVELYKRSQNGRPITPVNDGDFVIILPAMYTGSTDWLATPLGLTQGGFIIASFVNSHIQKNWLSYIEGENYFILTAALLGALLAHYFWGMFYVSALSLGTLALLLLGTGSFVVLGIEWSWFFTTTTFLSSSLIVALERARLSGLEQVRLENEMRTSEMVQRTFLSHSESSNKQINLEHFFRPATECSGDWWGHFAIDDHTYCIIIADAVGHGTPAALITAMAYSSYKTFAELNDHNVIERLSPSLILRHFNSVLFSAVKSSYFMTCICMFIDTETGKVTLANAGHARPIHLVHDIPGQQGVKNLASRGNPLGLNAGESFKDKEFQLAPGDRIVLFTDGLYECPNVKGEIWGKRSLQRLLHKIKDEDLYAMKNEIIRHAFAHMNSKPLDDDITLVTIEWKGPAKSKQSAA